MRAAGRGVTQQLSRCVPLGTLQLRAGLRQGRLLAVGGLQFLGGSAPAALRHQQHAQSLVRQRRVILDLNGAVEGRIALPGRSECGSSAGTGLSLHRLCVPSLGSWVHQL